MKFKVKKENDGYNELKTKILIGTLLLLAAAVMFIFLAYTIFLNNNFGDWIVSIIVGVFRVNYDTALAVYQRVFRNFREIYFLLAVIVIFFMVFRIYLNWFTRYFGEINRGIDALIREDGGEITLPTELSATEKKLNTIRHTLEKRKLDARLAEQRKNDLVVYLAHDLKTPLTSVIGYLTLLRDENNISQELREKYLSISVEKAERLEDLINEFFEITRFNLSGLELACSTVNLTRMLEQVAFEFQPMLSDKNLRCILHTEPDIMIRCDADKMQRVFDNLLRNAIYYSFADSTIEIAAAQDESNIILTFTNQGDTIPPEKLERIFEKFYRLDTARSSHTGGAGLGLAIAKEIVELHGGAITARSGEEKITFLVNLPQS